jgi:hypothetical protein
MNSDLKVINFPKIITFLRLLFLFVGILASFAIVMSTIELNREFIPTIVSGLSTGVSVIVGFAGGFVWIVLRRDFHITDLRIMALMF